MADRGGTRTGAAVILSALGCASVGCAPELFRARRAAAFAAGLQSPPAAPKTLPACNRPHLVRRCCKCRIHSAAAAGMQKLLLFTNKFTSRGEGGGGGGLKILARYLSILMAWIHDAGQAL